jgi:hypothetical protein
MRFFYLADQEKFPQQQQAIDCRMTVLLMSLYGQAFGQALWRILADHHVMMLTMLMILMMMMDGYDGNLDVDSGHNLIVEAIADVQGMGQYAG